MITNVNQCLQMFTNVNQCLQMFTNVNQCLQMFTNVKQCLQMFTNVNQCLQMFTNVNQCLQMVTNVYQHLWMCTAANFLLRHSTLFSLQSTLFWHFFICAPNDNNIAFLIIPSSTFLVRVKMASNAPVYKLETTANSIWPYLIDGQGNAIAWN